MIQIILATLVGISLMAVALGILAVYVLLFGFWGIVILVTAGLGYMSFQIGQAVREYHDN